MDRLQAENQQRLRTNIVDHMTRHIGQPEAAAAVEEGELFVFDAEQVEDGGVQVVDLDFVDGGAVADFVGFAVGGTAFYAAAGEPKTAGVRVVVAAGFAAGLGQR